jgi:hypothetical protein
MSKCWRGIPVALQNSQRIGFLYPVRDGLLSDADRSRYLGLCLAIQPHPPRRASPLMSISRRPTSHSKNRLIPCSTKLRVSSVRPARCKTCRRRFR